MQSGSADTVEVDKKENIRNDDATNEKAAIIWFNKHKVPLIVAACALVVVVTLVSVLATTLSNIYRIGKAEKVELGFTHAQVRKVLGEPFEATKTDSAWEYYDDSYTRVLKKLEKNMRAQEKALAEGDDELHDSLRTKAAALGEKLNGMTYKYIRVCFERGDGENAEYTAVSVFLDKKHTNRGDEGGKSVKKVELSNKKSCGFYCDERADNAMYLLDYRSGKPISYDAEFEGGGFYRAYLPDAKVSVAKGNRDNDYSPIATVEWSDTFAQYKLTNDAASVGVIDSAGVWYGKDVDFDGTMQPADRLKNTAYSKGLQNVVLPGGITAIGKEAFTGCRELSSIVLPSSLSRIESGAFFNCTALESFVLPARVTEIKSMTFHGCTALTSVMLHENVTKIESGAFMHSGITSITIPKGVTHIGKDAFYGCDSLTDIYCEADSKPLDWDSEWLGNCGATVHWT